MAKTLVTFDIYFWSNNLTNGQTKKIMCVLFSVIKCYVKVRGQQHVFI